MRNKALHKISALSLAAAMSLSMFGGTTINVAANDKISTYATDDAGYNYLGSVVNAAVDGNKVDLTISTGETLRFTFLESNVFRMYMAPAGEEFLEDPKPNSTDHTATIRNKTDEQYVSEYNVIPTLNDTETTVEISTADIKIEVNKAETLVKVSKTDGTIVFEEAAPLKYKNGSTYQTLKTDKNEYFYGGGTQNGRFSHKGKTIKIVNTNNWVDKGVASPNPFYWSTDGYGVVRNTWKPGEYNFDANGDDIVTTTHNEKRFDAYYFVDETPEGILKDYYEFTGNPVELPEYASYLGHLNCYNRDYWLEVAEGTDRAIKLGDKWYLESQSDNGGVKETLLGDRNMTAQQIIEDHKENDMPLGWFLPNDGYGCGYGQTDSQAGDLDNLADFANYAIENGIQTGLWTQSNLWPADPSNPQKGERDIYKEVESGVHSVKTDVAWVGAGYSMALNGISVAYDAIASKSNMKPNIVTLDGWAGTQRYGGIWTGDQSGGQWEYIRFHIPTYIGTSLSGQPNVGSDMDGIFGGSNKIVWTRDFQWKAFTTYMLDMDGWGSNQKTPWALGEDGTSINRTYLKLKAQLMPYINTISHTATAEGGLPMLRAMFLEEANKFTLGSATQYQYMWGDNFVVAPVYQNTNSDAEGNDIRNDIYLPGTSDVWIDYFTGEQYRGGQVLNNFDAPIWKLPVFVRNGSIIPMYPENNNPEALSETNKDGLDRSQRIVEFYPHKASEFELYEDDGKTLGGASSTTLFTSEVEGEIATLIANKAIGSYTSMVKERSNEFIVNVSEAPKSVKGTVKDKEVTFEKVDTQEEYDAAEGNVYFYNENPSIIVKNFASEGSKYANTNETTRPKLYIKSTEKLDVTAYDYTVVIDGFKNEQELGVNELDETLAVPTNLVEKDKTDSEITVAWDDMEEAVSYDIEVDGTVYRNIKTNSYTHFDLSYLTDHTYRVRTVAANGKYSNWTELITVKTADNPFRNVPNVTATWNYGASWGALENAFDHDQGTMFHSTNAVTPDQMLVMDLGAAYQLDKLVYQPRMDNKGNGTVKRMDVYASLDGVNYTKVWDGQENDAWKYSSDMDDPDLKEMSFNGRTARYLKLSCLESSGGFFSAAEITPYKVDGTDAWVVGDVNNSGDVNDNDLTFYENYVGLKPIDSDWEYSTLGNIDKNDIIDAYDISFVARMLGNPVNTSTATKGVDGKVAMIPSKTDIKAGDIVTLNIYGIGMKNVNAFSVELPVDTDNFEITNFGSATLDTYHMRNFSKTRLHSNQTTDNYACFTNVGQQELLNGTKSIATMTFKAIRDFTWEYDATRAVFVGQDLSTADAIIDPTQQPTAPETENILSVNDIKNISFTNDVKANMDGSELWQQSNWKTILFDGDKAGLAEFKYYYGNPDDIAAEVKLPTDINFEFNNAEPLSIVKVYNRDGGNGTVTSIKAVGYDGDTEYDLGTFDAKADVFEFNVPKEASQIDRVVITPMTSTGTATGSATGSETNRMLSLREIEFVTDTAVKATGIEFNDSSAKKVYVNEVATVSATVTPNNVSNPFYNVTSSDESIAQIIKIPVENEYIFGIKGVSAGTVTLTATSEDGSFTDTWTIEVDGGVNTALLDEQISKFEALYASLYTADSYNALATLVAEAKVLLESPDLTLEACNAKAVEITKALEALEFMGSDDSRPTSANLIDQAGMSRLGESSMSAAEKEHAGYVIDGDKSTIWHSNYNSSYKLPQWVAIDLGDVYNLEQVNMLPRQSGRNGHITHYRIEVSNDGENFTPVVEGYFDNDGYSLDDPDIAKEVKFAPVSARYVKFIAIESLGDRADAYASIAELNFFGKKDLPTIDEALDAASKVEPDKYTVSSYAPFEEAYNALASLNAETATEVEVEAAIIQLLSAKEALVLRASEASIQNVTDLVAEYEAVEKDYTEAEFAGMKAAIEAAKVILAKDADDIAMTEISLARISLLSEAMKLKELVDANTLLSNLTDQVEIANGILEEENLDALRPGKVQALRDAIAAAEALIKVESSDRVAIIEASVALQKAAEELWEIYDKTELNNLIAYAESITNKYTEDSWTALQNAIEAGKVVADNDDATESDVQNAINELSTAISNLQVSVDKSALANQISIAEKIVANIENYVSSTVNGLADLLAEAKAVYANGNATEAEVKNMTDALTAANMKARLKADKSGLENIINEALSIDLSQYTSSSATGLTNALANANKIMENEEVTQDEVDLAIATVKKAMDSLVKDAGNSGTPGGSGNTSGGTNTGDTTNTNGLLALMSLAAIAILGVARKKELLKK